MDRLPSFFSLLSAIIIITAGLISKWSPETIVLRTLLSVAVTAILGKVVIKIIVSLERIK